MGLFLVEKLFGIRHGQRGVFVQKGENWGGYRHSRDRVLVYPTLIL